MWNTLVFLAAAKPDSTVLNEFPMIMVHDAATTYLLAGGIISQKVYDFTKTQPTGGATELLRCGARAFDWRPQLKGGALQMHHGPILIEHSMSDAVDEMTSWCASSDELVVLGITDCDGGDACVAAVKALLTSKNISYVTDCGELKGLTVAAAKERALLPAGGHLLATFDCWQQNYNASIACRGFGDAAAAEEGGAEAEALTYTCWNTSATSSKPVGEMLAYLERVANQGPPSDGELYTAQALWEYGPEAIALGSLAGSSIIEDEEKSSLNAMVTARVATYANVNMIEVNNVCDGGPELYAALQKL